MSRIDRFPASSDWEEHFPDLIQCRLPRPLSDHFPLLLDSGGLVRGFCCFKFENMWLKAKGFGDLVNQWLNSYQCFGTPCFVLAYKLKHVKLDLKRWNNSGNVEERKKSLLAEIQTLDLLQEDRPLAEEIVKRDLLKVDVEKVVLMQEVSWRPKTRATWLKEGDHNTNFSTAFQIPTR